MLQAALTKIEALPHTFLVCCSQFRTTQAWGVTNQPDFLNAVIEIRSHYEPEDLLIALKKIEHQLGRQQTFRWGPRVIDIDILLYGERSLDLPNLVIPHPEMLNRQFVLEPLKEIAPEVVSTLLKQRG